MSTGANDEQYDEERPGLHEGDPVALTYTTPTDKHDRPWQRVLVDGDELMVREPKGAWFVSLAQGMAGNELAQASAVQSVLEKVFDAESATVLRERLADDDDDFDVEDLGNVLTSLREAWSRRRPTGPASGSRARSRGTGRRSTARAR